MRTLVAAAGLLLAACGPEMAELSDGDLDAIRSSIRYFMDGGVCYAASTYVGYGSGYYTLTYVPCDEVRALFREER